MGCFPGVLILCADVSEHSVSSIYIGGVSMKIELIESSETSAQKNSEVGESSKIKNITFRTRQKFEIKSCAFIS